jgi:hypothetical protein
MLPSYSSPQRVTLNSSDSYSTPSSASPYKGFSLADTTVNQLTPEQIEKYVQQVERKRQYNREYYHTKIKTKRESQQEELLRLRQDCQALQSRLEMVQQYVHQEVTASFEDKVIGLTEENQLLAADNEKLIRRGNQLERDNKLLQASLDHARKQVYDLMMEKADDILPRVTLNPQPNDQNHL